MTKETSTTAEDQAMTELHHMVDDLTKGIKALESRKAALEAKLSTLEA